MIHLSIITVCYNAKNDLYETICSLKRQEEHGLCIEHLIVDNDSTDGTEELVAAYRSDPCVNNNRVVYLREPDKGIYDAMNKGIKHARGEWVMLLNAGDTLYESSTLKELENRLSEDADILVGGYNRMNPYGSIILYPPTLDKIKERMIFCHQAIIFRGKTHIKYLYNLEYKIVADYDVILRMYLSNRKIVYINQCISNYDVNGVSANRMIDTHKEIFLVRKNNDVLQNPLRERVIFTYGLVKRHILSILPQRVRWKIVKVKNKLIKKTYY